MFNTKIFQKTRQNFELYWIKTKKLTSLETIVNDENVELLSGKRLNKLCVD